MATLPRSRSEELSVQKLEDTRADHGAKPG